MDLASCFVCYMELKITPTDAIWLFSLLAHYFMAPHHLSPSTPIGTLVVLA